METHTKLNPEHAASKQPVDKGEASRNAKGSSEKEANGDLLMSQ